VVLPDLKLVAQKEALLRVYVIRRQGRPRGHDGSRPPASSARRSRHAGADGAGDSADDGHSGPDPTKQYTVTVPATWVDVGLAVTVKIDAADALPRPTRPTTRRC